MMEAHHNNNSNKRVPARKNTNNGSTQRSMTRSADKELSKFMESDLEAVMNVNYENKLQVVLHSNENPPHNSSIHEDGEANYFNIENQ